MKSRGIMKVNCRRWLCGEAKTQSMKISISKAKRSENGLIKQCEKYQLNGYCVG
jgi:hypothetical protein